MIFLLLKSALLDDMFNSTAVMFILQVQVKQRLCHSLYNFPQCTCAVSVQSGQDVFLVDVCGEREFVDFLSCNDSVLQVHQIHDKLYKVFLDISLISNYTERITFGVQFFLAPLNGDILLLHH